MASTPIPEDSLLDYVDRVRGKVVLVTGAGSGFGREAALLFAKHGAKVVAADVNEAAVQATVAAITRDGGQAIACVCDVRSHASQLAVFEKAIATYGAVHVVLANAGIEDDGSFLSLAIVDGAPAAPDVKTIDVNLTGVLYTTQLALSYLRRNKDNLRALVITASWASFQALPRAPLYCVSKIAIVGLVRSLVVPCKKVGITISSIHPSFADTGLSTPELQKRLIANGVKLIPGQTVARTLLRAATDPGPDANGALWVMRDGASGVERVNSVEWGGIGTRVVGWNARL